MENYESIAKNFIEILPYRKPPFNSRNWGHPWHSLCSYHGKLKPSIAYFLVSLFTNPGDSILDPFCGVGTIPFEACLQGRQGIGNDLSELSYIVTKAKLEKPEYDDVKKVIRQLADYIHTKKNSFKYSSKDLPYKNFGFNGNMSDYFHMDTYIEILISREYFLERLSSLTSAESMVFSALLHILHGNRPYALSRTSHPLTPYYPKGEFQYKNLIKHITDKVEKSYSINDFSTYAGGKAILGDYNNLSEFEYQVDAVITSPPFADSMRFYIMNWMRLWLCGWEPDDYKIADVKFLDKSQKNNFDLYFSFFKMCHNVLKPNGKVILHLGKTNKYDMAQELSDRAQPYFLEVYRGNENVSGIEKHGIKDKGKTVEHQFLFLIKK